MPDGRKITHIAGPSHVAGVIAEWNPLHTGHVYMLQKIRETLGADTAVICCMSGDFVQRGDLAIIRREARAAAAVESGADLVLELPLPWAVSSAEKFAEGGVGVLSATGLVDTLCFGSECGDTAAIKRAASLLLREEFPPLLREELAKGVSFPAARQKAAERLDAQSGTGQTARPAGDVLARPNDILGVEYCKALLRHGSSIRPLAILRQGAGHGETRLQEAALPSASAVRVLLRAGERDAALACLPPAMRERFETEEQAGRAPVFYETVERAVLYRLRSMRREDFAALDEGREGLSNRLYRASRDAVSVEEFLARAKTRRYPLSRLRRMALRACLNLPPADCPAAPPYLRPLAMNGTGRALLARMRARAAVPIIQKTGQARKAGGEVWNLFSVEMRAAALYMLAYPDLTAAHVGAVRKEGPAH